MNKRPYIYLGLALVIAVIVFLVEKPYGPGRGATDEGPLIPGYDAKNITRIEISQLLSGVQIEKTENTWRVADLPTELRANVVGQVAKQGTKTQWYPADMSVIGSALGVFGDLARGIVVSTNPDYQELYRVGGSLGLNVKLYEGSHPIVDVVIGKTSSDFAGNYIRRADANEVMIADRTIEHLFPTTVPAWRDHTIWRVDPIGIVSVRIERPKGSYQLKRSENGAWVLVKSGAALNQEKVAALVNRLAHLVAAGFASNDDPRSNFKNSSLTITLQRTSGEELSLQAAGANNLKQLYARRAGSDQTYLIKDFGAELPDDPAALKE